MTTTDQSAERAAYERWMIDYWRAKGFGSRLTDAQMMSRREDGKYREPAHNVAWDLWQHLRASLPAQVPGWKLVPVEPTEEMLDAAARASMQHVIDCINDPKRAKEVGSEKMTRLTHASRYRTMLAASPTPPAQPQEPVSDDVEKVWREHWQDIVAPNGVIDVAQVKKELSDYAFLLDQVPKVYMHVTGGKLSKTNYTAQTVISESDDYITELVEQEKAEARPQEDAQLAIASSRDASGILWEGHSFGGPIKSQPQEDARDPRTPMIFSAREKLANELGVDHDSKFVSIIRGVEKHHGITFEASMSQEGTKP